MLKYDEVGEDGSDGSSKKGRESRSVLHVVNSRFPQADFVLMESMGLKDSSLSSTTPFATM